MGLGSVMQVGLSGMAAAESALDYAANNFANAQTNGFKAAHPVFATQPPLGDGAGGGVQTAGATVDFGQGTIVWGPSGSNLAIEGEGLFILVGPDGGRLYTRNGQFGLNAAGEMVAFGGYRLVGYTGSGSLSRLPIARFANPAGLRQLGRNLFAEGVSSGSPIVSTSGEDGAGRVVVGAVELSNTDVGRELIDLSLAELMFRANAQTIRTADSLMDELLDLGRRL